MQKLAQFMLPLLVRAGNLDISACRVSGSQLFSVLVLHWITRNGEACTVPASVALHTICAWNLDSTAVCSSYQAVTGSLSGSCLLMRKFGSSGRRLQDNDSVCGSTVGTRYFVP